jgi:NAD(P)-dependent dehydrogenase (short-subunit alcohol dehydrogenase family)
MMMRSFAAEHAGDGRGFVVIAPGWVRTDLRGRHALSWPPAWAMGGLTKRSMFGFRTISSTTSDPH